MYKNVFHIPVLLEEVIDFLKPKPNQNFIDCTVGFSGHAREILKRTSPGGKLLAIDLDPKALSETKKKLKEFGERCIFVEDNFVNLKKIVSSYEFNSVDGILLDLGLSSYQLSDKNRGFSYKEEGFLDMRFGRKDLKMTAEDIINQSSKEELTNIFVKHGDFKNFQAKRLAERIIQGRKKGKIKKTREFKNLVSEIIPSKFQKESILSRVFQAIRIEVNNELVNLEKVLKEAILILNSGGRIACISYHSLEDRIVKNIFKEESKDCICPDFIPECRCNHRAKIKIITKKPILSQDQEIKNNPRSRSAKMRVAERI